MSGFAIDSMHAPPRKAWRRKFHQELSARGVCADRTASFSRTMQMPVYLQILMKIGLHSTFRFGFANFSREKSPKTLEIAR
jgi:hypothetical protein